MTAELESTIGRQGHLALVIPFVHHFLSRLQELHTKAKLHKRQTTKVPTLCIADLELMQLMLFFLQKAKIELQMMGHTKISIAKLVAHSGMNIKTVRKYFPQLY